MPSPNTKKGPPVPMWAAIIVIVLVIAGIIGLYAWNSVPHGPAPERPGGPPAGVMGAPGGQTPQ